MLVDIHTHTFPDAMADATIAKLKQMSHTASVTNGTIGELQTSMKEVGVDYSVVLPVATNTRQVEKVNNVSAEINAMADKTGILSFGCIHPDSDNYKSEIARIKELGMPGLKLHPVYQGVDLDDPRYLRILDRAAEVGLIVLCHGGRDVGFPDRVNCTPAMVLHAVKEVGDFPLIMAHMGGWHQWDQVEDLLLNTKVMLDTAYVLGKIHPLGDGFYGPSDLPMMSDEQFCRIVRTFGAERVFWGTDIPWRGQQETMDSILSLPLTDEEKALILGGNAQKLLGLKERKKK